jgi:hypothetical protein
MSAADLWLLRVVIRASDKTGEAVDSEDFLSACEN